MREDPAHYELPSYENDLQEDNVAVELKRNILLPTPRQQDVDILPASSRSLCRQLVRVWQGTAF